MRQAQNSLESPLIRWHIGDAPAIGIQILAESVRQIQKLYPEFDCVLCINRTQGVPTLQGVECTHGIQGSPNRLRVVEQKVKDLKHFPFKFSAEDWKLCPPRMRLNAYEIVIDNDLVLTERLPSIDKFLLSDKPICLEAVHRAYGQFSEKIPEHIKINSGLYGFPPNFDFEQKLLDLWSNVNNWQSRFDEQGSVAAVISNADHITIPMTEVLPLGQGAKFKKGSAYHFLGANGGQSLAWEGYKANLPVI